MRKHLMGIGNLKVFFKRDVIYVLIILFCFVSSYGADKAIIKASILRGDSFVTAKTSTKDLEDIVAESLRKKGFEIVNTVIPQEHIFFVDLFVYQFSNQHPAITLIIRTKKGIHYIDQEHTRVYIDRNAANLKLALKLGERVPSKVDQDTRHKIGIADILTPNRIVTGSPLSKVSTKYFTTIKWADDKTVPFIVPSELSLFIFYVANYQGLRTHLQDRPMILQLKINSMARFELVDILNVLAWLNENERTQLQEFVDSFPMWITDSPVENIQVMFGESSR